MYLWGTYAVEQLQTGCNISSYRLCKTHQQDSSGLMVTYFPNSIVQKAWEEAVFQWAVSSPSWKEISTCESIDEL